MSNRTKAKKDAELIPNVAPRTEVSLKVTKTEMVEMVAEGLRQKAEADAEAARQTYNKAQEAASAYLQKVNEETAQDVIDAYKKSGYTLSASDVDVDYTHNYDKRKRTDPAKIFNVSIETRDKGFFPQKVISSSVNISYTYAVPTAVVKEVEKLNKKVEDARVAWNKAQQRVHEECSTKSVKAKMNARIIANSKGGDKLVENLYGMIDELHDAMKAPKQLNG